MRYPPKGKDWGTIRTIKVPTKQLSPLKGRLLLFWQ